MKKTEEVFLGADAMTQVITPQVWEPTLRPIHDDDLEEKPSAWEVVGWLTGFIVLGYMVLSVWAYHALESGDEVLRSEFLLAPFIWATKFFG